MVSAIISVIFGVLTWLTPIPSTVAILGIALGANGYLKERKKDVQTQQKRVKVIAITGMIICGIPVLVLLLGRAVGI